MLARFSVAFLPRKSGVEREEIGQGACAHDLIERIRILVRRTGRGCVGAKRIAVPTPHRFVHRLR